MEVDSNCGSGSQLQNFTCPANNLDNFTHHKVDLALIKERLKLQRAGLENDSIQINVL
jgi:hypothetical protein